MSLVNWSTNLFWWVGFQKATLKRYSAKLWNVKQCSTMTKISSRQSTGQAAGTLPAHYLISPCMDALPWLRTSVHVTISMVSTRLTPCFSQPNVQWGMEIRLGNPFTGNCVRFHKNSIFCNCGNIWEYTNFDQYSCHRILTWLQFQRRLHYRAWLVQATTPIMLVCFSTLLHNRFKKMMCSPQLSSRRQLLFQGLW